MDDAWLHTVSSAPQHLEARPVTHRRKPSLLQQPTEGPGNPTETTLSALTEEENPWNGPSSATLARRAQSYSDFYDVVLGRQRKEKANSRRSSLDRARERPMTRAPEIGFEVDFGLVEDCLLEESLAKYQAYHNQLRLSHSHLDSLLSSTTDTLTILATLSESFKSVEAQTNAFREQCEMLISEEKKLTRLADDIEENSRYYAFLEPFTRRLNAPGAANLVKGRDFPEMLTVLDNCLVYLETHPKQAEAANYRSRYRLLLTRGLTLIRHHFTKSLGDLATEITRRIQNGQLKDSTYSTLLYSKFRVPAPELKALGVEIQKRAVPTPDDVDAGREAEYASLLRELYQSYSTTRGRLILPLISKKIAELAASPQNNDMVNLAKSALSFVRGICLDEFDLWFEWFETEGHLYDFLESLIEPMHDHLRPRIIHETKLEKLCDTCAMIQGRYMTINADDLDEDEEDVDGSAVVEVRSMGAPQHRRRLDFGVLARSTLQDAQTRLVFLVLAALRDAIENYKPTPGDLDWPRISAQNGAVTKGPALSGTRSIIPPALPVSKATEDVADDAESVFSRQPATEKGSTLLTDRYPTFRKAIWLLRRIYRLVNSTVFDDLAHRIVHSTIQSLITASRQVTSRKTLEDGRLFLLTHLLHLKQQIVAFDIEFVPPEVEFDFSSVTNTFYELRDRGSLWNPVSWMRLVSGTMGGGLLPRVVENMLDAKVELDGQLRAVINDFVGGFADHISAPIEPEHVRNAKASKEGFDGVKAMRTVRGLAEKHVPILRRKLEEFITDGRTRETLVAAVRDQVVSHYEDFYDSFAEGQGRKASRKGKAREDEVWETHHFAEAMEGVFRVGPVFGRSDDDDDNDVGNVSD